MSERVSGSAVNPRLNFMFKKISVSTTSLVCWLNVQEFEAEMISRLDNNETIDNQSVYESMKRIYAKWERLRESSNEKPDFNFRLTRRGIIQIERALEGAQSAAL